MYLILFLLQHHKTEANPEASTKQPSEGVDKEPGWVAPKWTLTHSSSTCFLTSVSDKCKHPTVAFPFKDTRAKRRRRKRRAKRRKRGRRKRRNDKEETLLLQIQTTTGKGFIPLKYIFAGAEIRYETVSPLEGTGALLRRFLFYKTQIQGFKDSAIKNNLKDIRFTRTPKVLPGFFVCVYACTPNSVYNWRF